MTTQNERFQTLFKQYEKEKNHEPTGLREVIEWAVKEGKLELPDVDPYDVLTRQMGSALREQYEIDHATGRRYRVNHAVKMTKDGAQNTFWGIMGFAPRNHMQMAFTQRREQVIGDLAQLNTDVVVYNSKNPKEEPIQIVMDFTEDVAEREVVYLNRQTKKEAA